MSKCVLDANMINGVPHCGRCKSALGNTEDFKFITDMETGEHYNLFRRYCTKCDNISQYCIDIGLTERKIIPQDRIKVGKVTIEREED